MNILETFNLSKEYRLKGKGKCFLALNNINLSVKKGEIFGLLGPNGAGKTTLIQILSTIIQPTCGYAIINGINIITNPKDVKKSIALMWDSKLLYNRLTAYSNLKFFCKMYEIPNYKDKIDSISEDFGLKKWLNQYVGQFSGGMKMKLALCKTFLLNREISFMDEPTLGVDVKSKNFVINKLKDFKKTIILTTHDMNIVEELCDRIAFINKGNILKIGSKKDIKRLGKNEVKINIGIKKKKDQLKSELSHQRFIKEIDVTNEGLIISLIDNRFYQELFSILRNYPIQNIKEQGFSLDDVFLKLS